MVSILFFFSFFFSYGKINPYKMYGFVPANTAEQKSLTLRVICRSRSRSEGTEGGMCRAHVPRRLRAVRGCGSATAASLSPSLPPSFSAAFRINGYPRSSRARTSAHSGVLRGVRERSGEAGDGIFPSIRCWFLEGKPTRPDGDVQLLILPS